MSDIRIGDAGTSWPGNPSIEQSADSKNLYACRGGLRDWGLVLLLAATLMLSAVDRIGIAILIEPIKKDLRITDAQFGLLNGIAFGLIYAFMGIPLGWLADRWSRKGTIALGIGVWSLATGLCGVAASFWQFMLARIFVGAGEAGLSPAAYSLIHDRFGKTGLATAVSVLQIGGSLGSGIALLLTSYLFGIAGSGGLSTLPLVGQLQPWQQTFVLLALPGLPFVLAILCLRDRRGPLAAHHEAQPSLSLIEALRRNKQLYLNLFGGMAAIVVVTYALLSWMPAILGREYGWRTAEIGMAYGSIALVSAPAGLLVGGQLSDFLSRRSYANPYAVIPFGGAILGLCGAIAIPLATSPTQLLCAAALVHFCTSLPIGVIPAYLQLVTPADARGRVSAVYVMIINLFGLGLSSILIGAISSRFPHSPSALRLTIGYICIFCFSSAILLLFLLMRSSSGSTVRDQGR